MKHVDYEYTRGLDDEAIEERLRTTGTGVLSLASDNDAYAVPLCHYYDGDNLYFRLGATKGSEKWEYIERTETACYTVFGTTETADARELESWSIVATGALSALSDAKRDDFDTTEMNRRFAPLRVFGEAIEDIEINVVVLDVDTMTGRITLE